MTESPHAATPHVSALPDGLARLQTALAELGVRYELQVARSGLCWIAYSHQEWAFMALTPPNEVPVDATLATAMMFCMSRRITASGNDRATWTRLAFLPNVSDGTQEAAVSRRWRLDQQLHEAMHGYFGSEIAASLETLAMAALHGSPVYL